MKWFALLLLLLNAALWTGAPSWHPAPQGQTANQGALPRVSSLKTLDAPGSALPAESDYCARLGWFESEVAAGRAAERLELTDREFEVEPAERTLPPLHWVLIPPQPPEQARAVFADIQRRGIDSYLVAQGENRNAISLGLFESRQSAISVLEEKKRQNLNAVLAIFPRNQLSYALVFEVGPFRHSEEVSAAEADYGKNFDLVEIRPCEGVATPKKNP